MSIGEILMAQQSSQNRAGVSVYAEVINADEVDHPDYAPSDTQPPGVDDEPQSLEEALLG